MNIAYHELMNDSGLMIDPNKDVNEVGAFILAGKKNGCVILGGGSPKNFYLQGSRHSGSTVFRSAAMTISSS
jgi:deoxyhypusine synthase